MAIQKKASQGKANNFDFDKANAKLAASIKNAQAKGNLPNPEKKSDRMTGLRKGIEEMGDLRESFKAPVKVPQIVDAPPSEKILGILRNLKPEEQNKTLLEVTSIMTDESRQRLHDASDAANRADKNHEDLLSILGRGTANILNTAQQNKY